MKITYQLLDRLSACSDYLEEFDRRFPAREYPDGVEVTVERCVEHAQNFDWHWAAAKLLDDEGFNQFETLTSGNGVPQDPELAELERAYERITEKIHTATVGWYARFGYQQGDVLPTVLPVEARDARRAIMNEYREEYAELDRRTPRAYARIFATLAQTHPAPATIEAS